MLVKKDKSESSKTTETSKKTALTAVKGGRVTRTTAKTSNKTVSDSKKKVPSSEKTAETSEKTKKRRKPYPNSIECKAKRCKKEPGGIQMTALVNPSKPEVGYCANCPSCQSYLTTKKQESVARDKEKTSAAFLEGDVAVVKQTLNNKGNSNALPAVMRRTMSGDSVVTSAQTRIFSSPSPVRTDSGSSTPVHESDSSTSLYEDLFPKPTTQVLPEILTDIATLGVEGLDVAKSLTLMSGNMDARTSAEIDAAIALASMRFHPSQEICT